MNYSTAVFLINKNVRAITATYEAADNAPRSTFKTVDETIKVGDFIIVPTDTRHKMTVCKVTEVDTDPDFESAANVAWIIGVVDRSEFEHMTAQENTAIQAIKSAELRKKRDDLRKTMFADHIETLKALPIADMNGSAAPAPAEPAV